MTKSSLPEDSSHIARFTLSPHRSLSPRGFLILMSAISLVSFIAGFGFYLMGAWPVGGFFGLDVLLIYLAFKWNYRSARARELIDLSKDLLRVTTIEPNGKASVREFNPYWVRVGLHQRPDGRATLTLNSHGERHVIGKLLNDDEKREFSRVLSDALSTAQLGFNRT
jgi:uncharacterized membrane protein